jgi:hypothetical protein
LETKPTNGLVKVVPREGLGSIHIAHLQNRLDPEDHDHPRRVRDKLKTIATIALAHDESEVARNAILHASMCNDGCALRSSNLRNNTPGNSQCRSSKLSMYLMGSYG